MANFILILSGELGPSETEGAVGMAGLSLGGKEEHGFTVLMLNPGKLFSLQGWYIVFQLSGRMWIQVSLQLIHIFGQIGFAGTLLPTIIGKGS